MAAIKHVMHMRTDACLVAASVKDPAAFRALYERYAADVYAYFLRRSDSPDAALDLTAETFAQCWMSRRRFRDEAGGSAGPWLFGIARHVLLASVRRRELESRACAALGVEALVHGAIEPEGIWLDGLDEALADLPAEQREALRLRIEDDLTYDDVAAALVKSPGAARVAVHRALTTLRTRLAGAKEQSYDRTF